MNTQACRYYFGIAVQMLLFLGQMAFNLKHQMTGGLQLVTFIYDTLGLLQAPCTLLSYAQ